MENKSWTLESVGLTHTHTVHLYQTIKVKIEHIEPQQPAGRKLVQVTGI